MTSFHAVSLSVDDYNGDDENDDAVARLGLRVVPGFDRLTLTLPCCDNNMQGRKAISQHQSKYVLISRLLSTGVRPRGRGK